MKLEKLLRDVPVLECHEDLETDITSIAYDSRKVRSGGLFVAVSGLTADGNRFIPMALEKGARAVVTAVRPKEDIPYVLVENERLVFESEIWKGRACCPAFFRACGCNKAVDGV